MKINLTIDLKKLTISRVIKFLVISDLLFLGGWGLIGPILAVFILREVPGTTLFTVGAAVAAYWFAKSLFQLPIAILIDKIEGEKDDFYALLASLMLSGFVAMAYLLVDSVGGLMLVSALQGVAFAFYTPSWSGIFSRHLDKEHYALEWSLDSTTIGFAYGITALAGGAMANYFGFKSVFIFASLASFAAALLLFTVPNLILPKQKSNIALIRDHTPANINH